MAEGDHVDIPEEVNPSVPTLSPPPQTHAPLPLTPAGVLPVYSGALPTHLPPSASSGAPPPPASPTSAATNDQACIAALEGTVNQMATNMAELLALLRGPNRAPSSSTPPPGPGPTVDPTPWAPPVQAQENVEAPAPPTLYTSTGTVNQMATNMAELLALLRGPNRAPSSSTPPPGPGPTVDPTPWAPPVQAQENVEAPAPPTLYTSTVHPFTTQLPPPPAPSVVPPPPATFLSSEHVLSAPPPVSIPAPAMAYSVPPPVVFPVSTASAPTHLQAAELPSYPSLHPHVGLSYQAPPLIDTTFHEPGMPTHAAQFASPTHFFPEADTEQERRLKKMEETIRALQAGDTRPDARYGDCSLFPAMWLPLKFKFPEFKTYEGTTDPRHHLRHYRGKMLQYWEYEEFVIHSFQDSLSGSALDWFMSLKAEDIPTWEDLSRKFTDQYRYCGETPPTLLELSTKEMARGQKFEEYAAKWRAQAAKDIPPISEAQQIQLFHSTLRGVYYSHLLAHTSSFSDLIEAGKNIAQPRPHRQYPALPVPLSHIYRQIRDKIGTIAPGPSFDPTIQDQSKQCEYHRGAPGHTLDTCWRLRERIQEMIDAKGLVFNAIKPPNVTEEEAEAFMKVIKASEYKVVEQMAKSLAHISLLALLLNSEPHREALMRVLMAAQARRGNHLHRLTTHYGRLNRGTPVPPLSHFFPGPPIIIGSTSDGPSSDFDDTTDALPTVLHSNPNLRHVDLNPSEYCLGEPGPIYFGEGLDEDSQAPEIEESLHRLEDRQLTSVEPTKEINVGTEDEPRNLKIGTDKCQPLFRLLRKNAAIEWDEECQKAFDTIKAYLIQPSVLVPPTPGRPLVLYLTTKDAKLVPYHEYLEKLTENFEDISFTYTPRMTNQFADALATLASM
ncbi:hypothetical protein CRG98_016039, partial [Punica granatum]